MPPPRCRQIFGRDAEQAALLAALAGARDGRGSFVLLTGPAGIGKSRLTAALLDAADAAGVRVALGRATSAEAAVPYRPLTRALRPLLRDAPPPADRGLTTWRGALAPVLGEPGAVASGEGVAVRGEAVLQLLTQVAPAGAVLALEDLHWADRDTVAVLDYLADAVVTAAVFVLATARESPAVLDLADRLRGRRAVSAESLPPLPPDAVAQMVAECRPDADAALVAQVQRVADGIPLFVEEIATAGGVPASFAAAVTGQLDALDPDSRRVVEAAAVLGDAGSALLPQATGCDTSTVAVALRRAAETGLVVVDAGPARFRHALTREAVLTAMGPRRPAVAAAVLAAVDAGGTDAAADTVAAELAEQAGDGPRAATLLARSAARAAREGALPTAVATYTRAVRLLADHPAAPAVRRALVETLALAGRVDEALAEGAVLLAADDSPATRLALADAAARGARWPLAAQYLAGVPAGDRRDLLAAEIAFATGATEDARAAALRVGGADPDLRCRALVLLGRVERHSDLGAARAAFTEALGVARAARLALRELDALHELGTIDLLDHAGTDRLLEARRAAERIGALGTRAVLDLQLAAAYLSRFETDAAERCATAAAETADRLGLAAAAGKARCGLAETRVQRLDDRGMEALLAAAAAADPDEPFTAAFAWGQCRGILALLRGDADEALRHFERGMALLADVPHPEPVEFRALWPLLLAAAGDLRAPAALAEARASDLSITFANRGVLAYAAAILAGRAGRRAEARDLALRADAYLVRFPVWAHLARWCAAGPAAGDGWADAAAWLAQAEPAFAALGFAALARRCRAASAAGEVTAREAEVLALVGEGMANRQIADRLHLSPRTVEKHVESLLRKTGSRSRTQLAVWAQRRDGRAT